MKRSIWCALVIVSLTTVHGQNRDAIREAFRRTYPPGGPSFAVVVRGDLLTVGINGARGRGRGKAKVTLEVGENGWTQAGSLGREPATGTLPRGEIMRVDELRFSDDGIEVGLQSLESHDIVRDPQDPSRNRREPVATVLKANRSGAVDELQRRLHAYVRLFTRLDDARAYAATLDERQPDRRFTIAVVRRDGVMVPFASYDNGTWYNRWPRPTAEEDVPIGLVNIPADWWGIEGPATDWTAWTPDGQSRALHAVAPLAFDAHCLMNVGLRSDFKSMLPAPPLEEHHYPKDAVATNGAIPIEPVAALTASDGMWKNLEPLLADSLLAEEARQVRRLATDPRFEVVAPGVTRMQKTAAKLEVLCIAAGSAAGTLDAYFEASKHYDAVDKGGGPAPCGAVTFSSGFVHRTPDGSGVLDKRVATLLSDCTQWNLAFRRPLGIMRLPGGPVWIFQVSRWGGEVYELVQIVNNEAKVVMTTTGGSCGRLGN